MTEREKWQDRARSHAVQAVHDAAEGLAALAMRDAAEAKRCAHNAAVSTVWAQRAAALTMVAPDVPPERPDDGPTITISAGQLLTAPIPSAVSE